MEDCYEQTPETEIRASAAVALFSVLRQSAGAASARTP